MVVERVFSYIGVALLCVTWSVGATDYEKKDVPASSDEYLQLSEPERRVSGAYVGAGLMLSRISNSVLVRRNDSVVDDYKKTAMQPDLSLICGFGSTFYKQYYAGVELAFFKRFSKKTSRFRTNLAYDVELTHEASIGLNMDVRFGLQLPQQATLVYVTVGFARVIGSSAIVHSNGNKLRKSFGSFYPTFGFGAEYKINPKWNVRGDVRFSITSRDGRAYIVRDTTRMMWNTAGKPNRIAFGVSITRSM
jgi:hypothetical protein